MPKAEIITGGAGSGKTREIVSRLAALYRADPFTDALVLVPTVRHADQLRRRLVQECPVAMSLRVETMPQLSSDLASGAPVLSSARAMDELARVARRTANGGGAASYFAPIAATAGFVTMISTAVGSLLEEEADADALRHAAAQIDSEPARALAEIYTAYVAELERARLIHPSQVNQRVARAVHASASVPNVVMADGFQRFTSGELGLLSALAERADMTVAMDAGAAERSAYDFNRLREALPGATVIELPPPDADAAPARTKGEAGSREQHAREIARQIKRLMADDPTLRPSDCAVTFRQVTPYLSLMRRVFAEYEIPLDPAGGARLSDTPLGAWLRRLLGISENGWRVKDVVAILRSGVVNPGRWGITVEIVDALSQQARDKQIWSGYDKVESLTQETDDRLAGALRDIGELLDGLEPDAPGRERRLADALFGENGWLQDARDLDEETAQSVVNLRDYLTEMADAPGDSDADGAEQETYERFQERLNRRLSMPVLMRRTPGGVLLAPMHTMHGLRFRHVAVGGLSEGEFPLPRRSGELLSDVMRDSLRDAGLKLPPAPRSTEQELWDSVTSRADGATALWRYRINEGGKPVPAAWAFDAADAEPETVSPDVSPDRAASGRELAIACAAGWLDGAARRPLSSASGDGSSWDVVRIAAEIEQMRRSFRFAGEYEGQVADGLAPRLTGTGAEWSASRLDSYLTCSFQFFGRYVLGLRELDEETDEGDAATRGTVVHEILQDAFEQPSVKDAPLSEEALERVIAYIDTEGRKKWDDAPERYGFGRAALWRLEWARYRERIVAMLEIQNAWHEAEGDDFRVLGTELEFNEETPTNPPLRITGKIDRVDESARFGLFIYDYKTGRIPSQKDVREGKSAQLPLYAYAMRQHPRGADAHIQVAYAKLPSPNDNKPWALNSFSEDDAQALDAIVGILQGKRDLVEQGDFRVNPQVATCPAYCAMKRVCRVNAFSRHKDPA